MRIGIQRKRVPKWPWLVGLAAAALIIVAYSNLVDVRKVRQVADQGAPIGSGAATVAPGGPDPGEIAPPSSPLEALLPFGAEDVGQRVSVSGQVVGKPQTAGLFLLTDENTLVLVRGVKPVKSGARQDNVTGVLQALRPGDIERWEAEAELKEERGWIVAREVYVKVGNGADSTATKDASKKKS